MRPGPRLAIAGGGIAGLATALALTRRGLSATVFEQAEALEELGAGLQVTPNAWRVLAALGLEERLMALSVAPVAIRIRSGRHGGTLARMPLGEAAQARWGAPYRIVHRADLQDLLVAALADTNLADLRLGARIDRFALSGGRVALLSGDMELGAFDGLVGADGLWSGIRLQVTGEGAPHSSGKVAWRATMPADALPREIDPRETGLWFGRDAHLVHYAVRGGREINIVAVVADRWNVPGWSAPGEPAEIAGRFSRWPDAARRLVAGPPRWHKWALADRSPIARWGEGPVTLSGDAAHPMLPFMAQGAAMGLEDAHVLATCLDGAGDVAGAFRRYESRRRARTARVQRTARANGDIYHLGGVASRARDLGLSMMGTSGLMARWDWLYGWRG